MAVRKRNESSVIDLKGDDLLSWVSTEIKLELCCLYSSSFKFLFIPCKHSLYIFESF